jgi:cystathionine gamma-synthase
VVARERSATCEWIRSYQSVAGAVPSPFDCWLIRRSLATLPLRVRAQCANALEIAEYLHRHARVERVLYPGLADDSDHAVAKRQMRGFGAVVSVCVRGGASAALAVAARTRLFIRATSLGGVESLIEHRASVEGPDTLTPANLLRLSIGIENAQDLIADLEQALRPP